LLQLARQSESEPLTLKQIAEREGISIANAGKLLWILGNAGFVRSVRGVKGGYVLTRPAEDITVSEVIGVLGEDEMEQHCRSFPGTQEVCVHTSDCGIRPVLHTLNEVVRQVLSTITLAHLIHPEISVSQQLFQINRTPKTASQYHLR
jgi:Rrf2 family protein